MDDSRDIHMHTYIWLSIKAFYIIMCKKRAGDIIACLHIILQKTTLCCICHYFTYTSWFAHEYDIWITRGCVVTDILVDDDTQHIALTLTSSIVPGMQHNVFFTNMIWDGKSQTIYFPH